MPDPPLTTEQIDSICDRFEAGWKNRQPAPLEAVVRAAPPPTRPDLFRELLALERHYRAKDGRPLGTAEALARFGGLGPPLSSSSPGRIPAV